MVDRKNLPQSHGRDAGPRRFATLPFKRVAQSRTRARFTAAFTLTNYSGTRFGVGTSREVRLLSANAAWKHLGVKPVNDAHLVGDFQPSAYCFHNNEYWKNKALEPSEFRKLD